VYRFEPPGAYDQGDHFGMPCFDARRGDREKPWHPMVDVV
jgi:hypothetical protein